MLKVTKNKNKKVGEEENQEDPARVREAALNNPS